MARIAAANLPPMPFFYANEQYGLGFIPIVDPDPMVVYQRGNKGGVRFL